MDALIGAPARDAMIAKVTQRTASMQSPVALTESGPQVGRFWAVPAHLVSASRW